MRNKIELGHYNNLTVHTVTNLYLYGTLETPAREDRIRSEEQYRNPPTVSLDMGPFMTEGPGRYAHASMTPFVQQFFDTEHPVSLPDGRYTKEQLMQDFNYITDDFRISFKQLDIDHTSADYAERVYIYNSASFTISKEAVFVVEDGGKTKYVENMAVHAFDDNFDFQTADKTWKDEVVQLGNDIVLKREIDPDNIGRTVEIEYVHKENVPVIERYTALNFLSEQVAAARENSGTLAHTYFPMQEVIKELQEHGTIEPVEGREEHPEIPSDTTVYEPVGASYTFTVPSYDHGEKEKERDDAHRDDVGSSSSQHGYVPSVRDHDYRTLFEPYKNDLNLGDRKQLMEDVLAFEEKHGRPLSGNELERVIAGATHQIQEHKNELWESISAIPGLDEAQKEEAYEAFLQWENTHPGQTVTEEMVAGFGAEVVLPALVLESEDLDREEKDDLLRELAHAEEPDLEAFAHRLEEREEAHVQQENQEALEEWNLIQERNEAVIEQWHEECRHVEQENHEAVEKYERECEEYKEKLEEEKAEHEAELRAYEEAHRQWEEECARIERENAAEMDRFNREQELYEQAQAAQAAQDNNPPDDPTPDNPWNPDPDPDNGLGGAGRGL